MTNRKGIILAGGTGSRLYPATQAISKQLLPIYDKPMIYYPLCTLMRANIRDILVISTPKDTPLFQALLQGGQQWGLRLQYAVQHKPEGIAQAFLIAEDFLRNQPCTLILGDNLFHGNHLDKLLAQAHQCKRGATIFTSHVADPERYAIIDFDTHRHPIRLIEKPLSPCSPYAVTGLYFYDADVANIARSLIPSTRNELEITDVNNTYLNRNQLNIIELDHSSVWLDAGTPQSMLTASQYIHSIEIRHGLKIGCPEQIAYEKGWITARQLAYAADRLRHSDYGQYLLNLSNKDTPK